MGIALLCAVSVSAMDTGRAAMNSKAWRWWLRLPPGGGKPCDDEGMLRVASPTTLEIAQSLAQCHRALAQSKKSRKKRTLLRTQITTLTEELHAAAPGNAAGSLLYAVLVQAEVGRSPAYDQLHTAHIAALEEQGRCDSWLSRLPSVALEQIASYAIVGWCAARGMAACSHRLRVACWLAVERGRVGGLPSAEHIFCVPPCPDHRMIECFPYGLLQLLGAQVTVTYHPQKSKWGQSKHEWRYDLGRTSVRVLGVLAFLLSSEQGYSVEGSVDGQAWEHICGEDSRQDQDQDQEASLKSNRFRLLRVCAWSLEQDLPDHFKVEFFGDCWFEPHRKLQISDSTSTNP